MTGPGAAEVELRLDAGPEAVPRARRMVAGALADSGLHGRSGDAQLVVSELVTNALLHGQAPVVVRVEASGELVRLEVDDASNLPLVRPVTSTEAITGRGLSLVSALVDRWGVERTAHGKTVWAELTTAPAAAEPPGQEALAEDIDAILAHWADLEPSHPAGRFTVQLGDVPTDLLLAAKSHVDNLIREFALAASGAASGTTEQVPPRLGHLLEAVTTRFAEARQSIKQQALEAAARGEARTRLQLTLPVDAAAAGEEYLAALDEVDAYARAARLLTLESPPQHRAFRHWYVSSLVEQLRALGRGAAPPPAPTFERFLLDQFGDLAAARRLSERTARLQAATAALAQASTAEQVAAAVVAEGTAAFGAVAGSLMVPLDDDHLAVPGAVGYPDELVDQLRAEHRSAPLPAAEALRTGRAVWLESRLERDARFPELAGMEPGTVAMCALPLIADGQVLGVLRFSFALPRVFDADERRFADALAAQTAAALHRAQRFAVERHARARTGFLAEATESLSSSLDPERTLRSLTGLLVPGLADWAVALLFDESRGATWVNVVHRDPRLNALLQAALAPLAELPNAAAAAALLHACAPGAAPEPRDVPAGLRAWLRQPPPADLPAPGTAAGPGLPAGPEGGGEADPDGPAALAALGGHTWLAASLATRGELVGAVGLGRDAATPHRPEERQTVADLAARASVAAVNAQRYARERQTAITLQRSLLPQQLPHLAGIDIAWRYLPAGAGSLVGGDWYDVLPLEDGRVALLIGDVMGRGVQAAAVMGQLRATARAYASTQLEPAGILDQLDLAVTRLEQGRITTAALAVLDPRARLLTVASAGHLPPLLSGAGEPPRFAPVTPGPPLGVGPLPPGRSGASAGPRYAQVSLPFPPGSTVLLYTDGLVEDRNRDLDDGMEMLLAAAAQAGSAEQLCERALAAFRTAGEHDDDTALLAVTLLADGPGGAGSAGVA